ncbi:SCO4225 family membrane protein [Actinomadura scrupuli]|uniref:SCO4225 family membrane protein n=1 Tax=Actinomadura scrupuli TaxID=559629 RepID=UPI003D9890DB
MRIIEILPIAYALLVTAVGVYTKIALRTDGQGLSSIPLVLLTAPTCFLTAPLYDAGLLPEKQNLMLALDVAAGYLQATALWLVLRIIL